MGELRSAFLAMGILWRAVSVAMKSRSLGVKDRLLYINSLSQSMHKLLNALDRGVETFDRTRSLRSFESENGN